MEKKIIGGIEGGGTYSTLVLLNEDGKELARVPGPDTNHWNIGMQECQKRIANMVTEGKTKAGIPQDQKLYALGLCLSGCEQTESNSTLRTELLTTYPNVASHVTVASDTDGSIATVAPNGGMVLISGTGSNCLLINPDGTRWRCGGWGWLIGDEGSAFWISLRAIKTIFDHKDGLVTCPHNTNWVWEQIRAYFNVDIPSDLLAHCYSNFEKNKIAGLCQRLAEGAEQGDELCRHLFQQAGDVLAAHILALVPRVSRELQTTPGGFHVLCVGSVWKSWSLLSPGFIPRLQKGDIEELSLSRLTTTTALGAAYLAADTFNVPLPKTYDDNQEVFYHYKR